MRYAILSDVHANVEALDAALAAADAEGADRVVVLGDVVGYHADPNACVERLRARGAVAIAGNHDRAATGRSPFDDFGETARRAIRWTRAELTPENHAWLVSLPITASLEGRFLLFHGALHPAPDSDLHLTTAPRVERSFEALVRRHRGFRVAFFGHTHRPVVHERGARGPHRSLEGRTQILHAGSHYLINPGSVGQSRDGDPRASFLILDADAGAVTFHRAAYDRAACLAKAARAGLLPARPAAARPPSIRIDRGLRRVSGWFETGFEAFRRRFV